MPKASFASRGDPHDNSSGRRRLISSYDVFQDCVRSFRRRLFQTSVGEFSRLVRRHVTSHRSRLTCRSSQRRTSKVAGRNRYAHRVGRTLLQCTVGDRSPSIDNLSKGSTQHTSGARIRAGRLTPCPNLLSKYSAKAACGLAAGVIGFLYWN